MFGKQRIRRLGGSMTTAGALLLLMAVLSGCTDPTLAVVTESQGRLIALIDPCRPDRHDWDALIVEDAESGNRLWEVEAITGGKVDMQEVIYGRPPEGAREVQPPLDMAAVETITLVWSSDSEAGMQWSFDTRKVRSEVALEPDQSYSVLSDWTTCNR